ncbi:hypothetical protein QAD02_012268 [Eretmocerus hayati]|uniref:Uncharacterized protein n=1 Tax=Eretmocerus hayati TaxID=131215 RepID=A0ACC2P0X0_9HYME|nr:hypothetical protein QAD02_012268 [Eretmocerus hayati]
MDLFSIGLDTDHLYNISTGRAASDKVSHSLSDLLKTGETLRDKLIDECANDPHRFENPLHKNNYKSFVDDNPKKRDKIIGKIQGLKEQCDIFGRLLAISNENDLDMVSVMEYALTDGPTCLSHPDGTMNKTDKSKLSNASLTGFSPSNPTSVQYTIIDGYFFAPY